MTASIIDLIHFSRGRFVLFQELCNRRVQGLSQDVRLFVIERRCQVLKRRPEREELTQRVPTQVPFLLKLLHVFWRRTAGARFKQAAAIDKRYDRQHFGAGAELQDGKQVSQVVSKDVPSHRDCALTLSNSR